MAAVKLLGAWFSPFSRRVEMALKLKGVPYKYIEEDLSNKSDLLVKYNPVHKKVPVLLHNGKIICESLVILEYIDETFEGLSLQPKDANERALSRFWAKFINDKCTVTMWKACSSKGEEREKLLEEAIEQLNFLDNELKGKKFFGGESFGFVDLAANSLAYWLGVTVEVAGIEIVTKENHPNLYQWIDEYLNDDFVKENLPDKEKITAFFDALTRPPVGNEYRPKVR